MRHLDLFSGIGGFALAARRVWQEAHSIAAFCEIDKFCRKVLQKNFPGVPIHDDIHTLDGSRFGTIDLLTGGFPCQPFSIAGKRQGKNDDRYLWDEMFRVITEARPRWIVAENVTGIIQLALDNVLSDVENAGYAVETCIIPACSVNAPHKRERVWIIANADSASAGHTLQAGRNITRGILQNTSITDTWSKQREKRATQPVSGFSDVQRQFERGSTHISHRFDTTEPPLCRTDDEIPNRVDRIKSLGNAIVPQVAVEIFLAIHSLEIL
jgi:DNA (cytosine-5)-methyltransferase 1